MGGTGGTKVLDGALRRSDGVGRRIGDVDFPREGTVFSSRSGERGMPAGTKFSESEQRTNCEDLLSGMLTDDLFCCLTDGLSIESQAMLDCFVDEDRIHVDLHSGK